MTMRESIFVCRFTSRHDRRTAHMRAWDEREAEQVFRDELAGEDVHEPGTIEVVGGRARIQAPFEPASAAR